MSKRFFEDTGHASKYADFRPKPPPQLGDRILSFLKTKYIGPLELCVDVGCGNGQCVPLFSSRFRKVLATDISPAQIELALSSPYPSNVQFQVSAAERIAVESGSVQVLNSSEACHWFDLPVFFKEVDRVLSPGGVVALSGYSRPIFVDPTRSAELRHLIDQFYDVHMASYRQAGSNEILNEYRNIKIPYEHNVREEIWSPETTVPIGSLVGELASFSAFPMFCRENGNEAGQAVLDQFIQNCQRVLGTVEPPENISLTFKRKYFLLMGRKPFNKC